MSVEGGGGLSQSLLLYQKKLGIFYTRGGGVIPKIPIPKWLFFSFLGYKMIICHCLKHLTVPLAPVMAKGLSLVTLYDD